MDNTDNIKTQAQVDLTADDAELTLAHEKIASALIRSNIPFSFSEIYDHIYIGTDIAIISVKDVQMALSDIGNGVDPYPGNWFTIDGCDEVYAEILKGNDKSISIRVAFPTDGDD